MSYIKNILKLKNKNNENNNDIEIGNLYDKYKLPMHNNAILSPKNVVNKYWMDSSNPLFKKKVRIDIPEKSKNIENEPFNEYNIKKSGIMVPSIKEIIDNPYHTDDSNNSVDLDDSPDLDTLRELLRQRIDNRITELSAKLSIIRYKLIIIQKKFRKYSLIIIYLASLLTVIEGIKNSEYVVKLLNNNVTLKSIINLLPLIISAGITLLGTVLKFYKYEEKIATYATTIESSLNTWFKFKTIKEKISCDTNDHKLYKSSMASYLNEAFKSFLSCRILIDKNLNQNDRIKYANYIKEKEKILIKDLSEKEKKEYQDKYGFKPEEFDWNEVI